jgi:hypothetical protein
MNEFDHFKVFILYSGDVVADVNHLPTKRIHLVNFFYIVIEDDSAKYVNVWQPCSDVLFTSRDGR